MNPAQFTDSIATFNSTNTYYMHYNKVPSRNKCYCDRFASMTNNVDCKTHTEFDGD